MRHAKKLASLLLALVMALSMSVTAFAAQEGELTGGSITINDAVEGQTYKVYQILYLESYSTDENGTATGAYAYKANSAWESWLKTQTAYVSIDSQGYVTWVENASPAEFAKLAQAYAKTYSINPDATADTVTTTTVKFENLKLGYYLVDTTLGTLCSLDTTNPNVVMEEKNEAPSNVKTVEEDSNHQYGNVNDADIGQTVNFKSTITLPKGSENVTFHDTMSAGLTLDASSIKVYTDAAMTTELAADNYDVTTTDLTDNCTFEVSFKQTYLDGLAADSTTVYVGYSATVNANAVVGGNGNPNESKVSYGDSTNTKTTPSSITKTYTWSFDVLKYGNGDETKVLENAQFVLLNNDKTKVATIVDGKLTGWADVPAAGTDGTITWPANTALTTNAQGKIDIAGLDADTYYLREVKAPAGYNKLADDVTVTINPTEGTDADGNKTLTLTPVTAKVNNQSGSELPSTGGMGTTIFYVIGSILLIGAAVLLITKKRMSAEK